MMGSGEEPVVANFVVIGTAPTPFWTVDAVELGPNLTVVVVPEPVPAMVLVVVVGATVVEVVGGVVVGVVTGVTGVVGVVAGVVGVVGAGVVGVVGAGVVGVVGATNAHVNPGPAVTTWIDVIQNRVVAPSSVQAKPML